MNDRKYLSSVHGSAVILSGAEGDAKNLNCLDSSSSRFAVLLRMTLRYSLNDTLLIFKKPLTGTLVTDALVLWRLVHWRTGALARWLLMLWCSGALVTGAWVFSAYAQESKPNPVSQLVAKAADSSSLISLDLKGVDILELLKMLSTKTGLNIVPTKNVNGRVNLFINNISFEDALDIVMVSNDLAAQKSGNIINVMTAAEYQALYGKKYNEKRKVDTVKLNYARPKDVSAALESIKSDIGKIVVDEASGTLILIDIPEKIEQMEAMVKKLDQSIVTEVFPLNYAKAEDIESKISKILSSSTHTLQIDKRTNKIIVTDFPEKINEIKRMVKEFDEEPKQVLIETEIWQLSLSGKFQRGVDWEKLFSGGLKDLDFKGKFPLGLATTAIRQEVSFGTLSRDKYTSVIQFLSTYGKTDILSRPRIAVLNNEEAKILIGSKEAFVTTTTSQASSSTTVAESVSYIDVGIKLNVVPIISKDGFITMKIKPEVSSVRETLTTEAGSKIPIVETSEVETTIKIKADSTILIAGLIKEKSTEERSGVPGLMKLPVIGWLFGKYEKGPLSEPRKTELIICITPRIITGEAVDSVFGSRSSGLGLQELGKVDVK